MHSPLAVLFCLCIHVNSQELTIVVHMCTLGSERWPDGSRLRFVAGDQLGAVDEVALPSLLPNEITDISVLMVSPSESRMYHGQWQMCTPSGESFGGKSAIE